MLLSHAGALLLTLLMALLVRASTHLAGVCFPSHLCASVQRATRGVRSHARVAGRGGHAGLHHGVTLLVVAHPDDESMCAAGLSRSISTSLAWLTSRDVTQPVTACRFFAPTVAALTGAGVPVHLLCMSTGVHTVALGKTQRRATLLVYTRESHLLAVQRNTLTNTHRQRRRLRASQTR